MFNSVCYHCLLHCCRCRPVSVTPSSFYSVMRGGASAVSSTDPVAEPCSVPRCGRGLPRCTAAVRSSPGRGRRYAQSSGHSRGRRSTHNTRRTCHCCRPNNVTQAHTSNDGEITLATLNISVNSPHKFSEVLCCF